MAPDAPNPDARPFDPAWLISRRWFRTKSRPLETVTVHDAVAVGDRAWLLVLVARFADGGDARYFVPATGTPGHYAEPADGAGVWREFARRMADGGQRADGARGAFTFEPAAALEGLMPGGAEEADRLDEQRLQVEQSNTSVRLGDRLLLKLYRLLEEGTNPEVELMTFLTDAGFAHAPLAAGSVRYLSNAASSAAAVLQSFISARGDGWAWMLERLASPPQGPVQALAAAAQLGGITAELHAALKSQPLQPGFAARPARPDELAAWQQGAEKQLDAALDTLSGDDRRRLERLSASVREGFGAFASARDAPVSRIHGDYHLGQLLSTDGGFLVTDFEGEPARPLDQRRQPASPLRDVAGMLRSLDYAARTAERREPAFQPDPWLRDARAAFLGAYGGAGESPLLTAFELEKACYEIRYEANYRPDWVWLPMQAIERLA